MIIIAFIVMFLHQFKLLLESFGPLSVGTENCNFFVFTASNKLAILVSESCNLTIMGLEGSLKLVVGIPDID